MFALRRQWDHLVSSLWLLTLTIAWSSVGWSFASDLGAAGASIALAAGVGALIGLALGRWELPRVAPLTTGLATSALIWIAVAGAIAARANVVFVAAIVAFVALLAADLVPIAAVSASGLAGTDDGAVTPQAMGSVSRRALAASSFATALSWAIAIPAGTAGVVLGLAADPYALALSAVVGGALLSQARSHTAVARVLAFALAGGASLVAAGIGGLAAGATSRILVLVAAIVVLAVALAISVVRPSTVAGIRIGRWLDRLDIVLVLCCPALILGVLGVYAAVADWLSRI